MWPDDQRQLLQRHALGQRQVGLDLRPVDGLVADALHGRERGARDLLALLELQLQRAASAVEQIGLSRLDVAIGDDDEEVLVARMRTEGHLDRKSTRLNSSHRCISYAVFCLK